MAELDWSDLRYALAVGNTGGLAAAARQLGVNHTTVLRRLDALEARLGARLDTLVMLLFHSASLNRRPASVSSIS